MRTLIKGLIFSILALPSIEGMSQKTVNLLDTIQVGTIEQTYFIDSLRTSESKTMIFILVDANNSGTIQFHVGGNITSASYPYPAGSRVPLTIVNGTSRGRLRAKGSASGQVFTISQ